MRVPRAAGAVASGLRFKSSAALTQDIRPSSASSLSTASLSEPTTSRCLCAWFPIHLQSKYAFSLHLICIVYLFSLHLICIVSPFSLYSIYPRHSPAPVLQGNSRRVRHNPGGLLVLARGAPLQYPGEVGQEGRRCKVSSDGLLLRHDLVSLRLCSLQVRVC